MMTHFVGLDVSQKMTAICVVDNASRKPLRCASFRGDDPRATIVAGKPKRQTAYAEALLRA